MKITRAALALAVAYGSLASVGAAFAQSSPVVKPMIPRVDGDVDIRYTPPREEIVVDSSVQGVRPKPLRVGARAFVDRHGTADGQFDAGTYVTLDGDDFLGAEYWYEKGEPTTPILKGLDRACDQLGVC